MVQIRSSSLGSLGTFATKTYQEGDLILEEDPLVTLDPNNDGDESQKQIIIRMLDLMHGSSKQATTTTTTTIATTTTATSSSATMPDSPSWEDVIIHPPSGEIPLESHGKFRRMVQIGLWYYYSNPLRHLDSESKQRLMDLYTPSITEATKTSSSSSLSSSSPLEETLVHLAQQAVGYIQTQLTAATTNPSAEQAMELEKIILIWACNAFEGGRIYVQLSRINHSCNPNAVIQTNSETQRLVAATTIAEGEEITISYLGLFLYAERHVRRHILQQAKYFICACPRCCSSSSSSNHITTTTTNSSPDDKASQIPCPICHPRQQPTQMLEEDVQYDDEQMVHYITCYNSYDLEESSICPHCKSKPSSTSSGYNKLQKVMSNVTQKIVAFLQSYPDSSTDERNKTLMNHPFEETGPRDHPKKGQPQEEGEDDDDQEQLLEEHVTLASTVMGDRHWTTNLLLLLHLNRRLSNMSQNMLLTQELPELDEVAAAIDSLERVCRFVAGLELKLHMGHILSDIIVGVARMLVSLGDEKSQKYAADWLERIDRYVTLFESQGRQTVVAALKVAWKKKKKNQDQKIAPDTATKAVAGSVEVDDDDHDDHDDMKPAKKKSKQQ